MRLASMNNQLGQLARLRLFVVPCGAGATDSLMMTVVHQLSMQMAMKNARARARPVTLALEGKNHCGAHRRTDPKTV